MPIFFSCSCGKTFRAPDSAVGKRVRCPKCGSVIVVPEAKPEDESSAADDAGHPSSPPGVAKKPSRTPSAGWGELPPAKEDRPAVDDRARPPAKQRHKTAPSRTPSTNLLEYSYWFLLLTFIPLAFSLLHERKEDPVDRLIRSLEKSAPPKEEKAAPKGKGAPKEKKAVPKVVEEPILLEGSLDDLLARLPGNRLEGALLPRQSFMHWLYAVLAGSVFLALTFVLFPGASQPIPLLVLAVFTATIGIVLLLLAQLLAEWTQGHILVSGNMVIMLLFWIAWAIGFSYRAAVDPDVGLVPSFFGFTFGVGFCEEVCKVLPLLWYYRVKGTLPGRTACAWGFASGIGFGVSEGIMYSADFYNGIASGESYLVRFISCVALHGIWSASAALFIYRYRHLIQAEFVWYEFIPRALFMVGIPMILHGLYDTFLKRELNVLALLVALASFAWFVWSVERTRRGETSPSMALGRA